MEFILVKKRQKKKRSLEVWGLQVVLLLCLGFLFCCMTQLLLCCWYVALFSRSVKLCNAFFIFTTKTIKVIFWKKLVVMPLFSNVIWGNVSGIVPGLGQHLPSFLQLWKAIRAHFPISSAEDTPLWDLCVWLSHCKANILCWSFEAWIPF